jgi:3-oxoacyl-[acyl-carrier protein] reductase
MDLHLKDKVAIVTGSSQGIGLGIAKGLLAERCHVTICGRDKAKLDKAAEGLRADPEDHVLAVAGDGTKPDDAERIVDETVRAFGRLDILVNCFGRVPGAKTLLDTPDALWTLGVDANLMAPVRFSRLAVPHMQKVGAGVIINIASIYGREWGGTAPYNATKAAEIALAKSLSRELAPLNIRVNSVAPGSILFPGGGWDQRVKADPEGMARFVKAEIPFGRFGTVEEVADVVVFLCSDRARWITGACITVDGGQSRSNI